MDLNWENGIDEFAKSLEKLNDNQVKNLTKRRIMLEDFDPSKHSIVKQDMYTQFLNVAFTGIIQNQYYMSAKEVLKYSLPLHMYVMAKEPAFYRAVIEAARETGMKDQVLIALLLMTNNPKFSDEEILKLLLTFPPNLVVKKFVNVKRLNNAYIGGLGTREKKILKEYLRHYLSSPYYVLKYAKYLKQICNLVHLNAKEEGKLIENALKFIYEKSYEGEFADFQKVNETLKQGKLPKEKLRMKIPFNLVRTRVASEKWDEWILENTDLSGHTLIMQAVSLYKEVPEIVNLLNRALNTKYMTADKILKAAIASHQKRYDELTLTLAKVYLQKAVDAYKDFVLPIETPKIGLILDESGSMDPKSLRGLFFKALSIVAPLGKLVKKLVLFSEEARVESPELLQSFEGLLALSESAAADWTNIKAGLLTMIESPEYEEIDTIIIVTDEMMNESTIEPTEEALIKRMLKDGKVVIIINPSPYSTAMTREHENLIYLRAINPEGLAAALKLAQLKKSLKGAKKEEVLDLVAKIKAKKKRKKGDESESDV